MFTRADANQLRECLLPFEFNPQSDNSKLVQSYRDHYRLNFNALNFAVRHSLGTLASGQFQIVCHYFSIPGTPQGKRKGTAFLLHGYLDHTGIYGHLIEHCLQLGFAVVIFDLPGHGLSSGAAASIDSFRRYGEAFLNVLQKAEQQKVSQPWITIGQSTGASVIIDSLLDQNLSGRFNIDHYLLLGPLLRPKNWFTSKILFAFTRWFVSSTRRTFSISSHDQEFLDFLKNADDLQSKFLHRDWIRAMIDYQTRFYQAAVSGQSLHIIQGSGDDTVDWPHNLAQLQTKFTGSKCYMIPGARHQLVNESATYREKLFSLIDQIVG